MKKFQIGLSVFLFLLFSFLVYSLYPKINYKSDDLNSAGSIYITDRFGKVITDKQKKNGYSIMLPTKMESEFIKSLIKIEDSDYYKHYGVSIKSKIRALITNLKYQKIVSGGSTITEQYVKNKHFKGYKRTVLQKAREAFLAFIYNFEYDKDLILQLYIHNAYFGNQLYGVGTAMEVYFDKKDMDKLTDEEITLLISLIHNPGVKSLEEKYFRKYFDSIKTKLGYDFERTIFKLNKKKNIDKFPFVTNRYLNECKNKDCSNFKSTIDLDFTRFVEKQLDKTLKDLKLNNVTNGAVLVIDPKTKEVLVYAGSKDFYAKDIDGQVDVITSLRQPGSTLKPFLYLQALKNGADLDKFIVDIESQYNSFQKNKVYISENYSLKEYGLVRFKKAIGNSLNNASVRLAKEIGLKKVWQFFKDYGIILNNSPEHYGYSLVLGNPSISLENLVLSYINLIPDYKVYKNDKLTFSYDETPGGIDGITIKDHVYKIRLLKNIDSEKYLLYQILKNPDNRDRSFGVNSILNTSMYQAVKTGTSSDFRDNLIVSYNPDLIVGIWIGNNDNSSMEGISGITGAGYLWHQIIEYATKNNIIQDKKYKIPDNIENFYYCLDKDCIRKEVSYKKRETKYESAISEQLYLKNDLFEKLDDFERVKLKNLGFELK